MSRMVPAPLSVFLVALAARVLYNCVQLEHRICHFGDAYNFLRTGSCLLQAVAKTRSPMDVLNIFFAPSAPSEHLLQSVTSLNLSDRLLIDGPVFPAYLAMIEWFSGVDPLHPIFDGCSVKLTLCNSLMDALTCVLVYACGRLAFNRRIALIAGLMFALYPAAIINTQHCYSEQFSYFVLTCWTALTLWLSLRHVKSRNWRLAGLAALGVVTGVLMLSKPAFVLLPPLVVAVIVGLRSKQTLSAFKLQPVKMIAGLATLMAGFAISVSPWLFFNKATSGQWSLFVNRVPAFNIFHGNQLKTDGWRCYPYRGCFSGENSEVVRTVIRDGMKEPVAFAGLELKKLARLWAGVWNEYHYPLFGVPIELQSLAHQLILFFSAVSIPVLLRKRRSYALSRELCAGLTLAVIVLFHFAYLPFEAISRYAVTAMPSACLLAAFAITFGFRKLKSFFPIVVSACAAFAVLSAQGQLASGLAGLLPGSLTALSPLLAWLLSALPFVVVVALVFKFVSREVGSSKIGLTVFGALSTMVLFISLASSVQSNDWREWSVTLSEKAKVSRQFGLPDGSIRSDVAFVLVDLDSSVLSPRLNLSINGARLTAEPFPLARLMPDNKDILQCLAIQGEGMGRDFRGFRHWWVVPFSSQLLRQGSNNTIEISSDYPQDKTRIFGDIVADHQASATNDGTTQLPSLYSYSYTKGFTTFDHRDPRVFEPVDVLGQTTSSFLEVDGRKNEQDLSNAPGQQSGRYRIYVMAPHSTVATYLGDASTAPTHPSAEQTLYEQPVVSDKAVVVSAADPLSFSPIKPIELSSALPLQTRFNFACELKGTHGSHPVFVSLSFIGVDAGGATHHWNSQWQPIGIPLSSGTWLATSFSDEIPNDVLRLKGLHVEFLFSPFQPDYLFLRRKQALKCKMEVKEAKFSLLEPLGLPDNEHRDWDVF